MTRIQNLIIGAGPAGLAVAGRLSKLNIPYEIIEMTDNVASTWRNHYDRLHLHTAKDLSHLPHLKFPKEYPIYVSKNDVVSYMENYAEHFNIKPHFREKATSIKNENGTWITTTASDKVWQSDSIIIGTGSNRVQNSPSWPGLDNFKGIIQHSKDYRNGKEYKDKNVLIIGMGNTGAELAIDLNENGAKTYISVRGPVNIVTRDFNGKPTQYTAIKLQKLPPWLNDFIANTVQKLTIGDLSKYGIQNLKMSPSAQLRELGKTPIIDLGTIDLIKKGEVNIKPGIQNFTQNGIVFENGEKQEFDAVILATGYKPEVEDFLESTEHIFNSLNLPKSPIIEQNKGLYFIGFDLYNGGVLYSIHRNSELIVKDILKRGIS
jgi:pyruvate/2-oxoglutarate dehydrogenase complex dihydrolipoamide dehydrogenase (E3) component